MRFAVTPLAMNHQQAAQLAAPGVLDEAVHLTPTLDERTTHQIELRLGWVAALAQALQHTGLDAIAAKLDRVMRREMLHVAVGQPVQLIAQGLLRVFTPCQLSLAGALAGRGDIGAVLAARQGSNALHLTTEQIIRLGTAQLTGMRRRHHCRGKT